MALMMPPPMRTTSGSAKVAMRSGSWFVMPSGRVVCKCNGACHSVQRFAARVSATKITIFKMDLIKLIYLTVSRTWRTLRQMTNLLPERLRNHGMPVTAQRLWLFCGRWRACPHSNGGCHCGESAVGDRLRIEARQIYNVLGALSEKGLIRQHTAIRLTGAV